MKVSTGVAIIGIATFISLIIANRSTGSDPGLGGIILWFWPPLLGLICSAHFLFICALTANKKVRTVTALVLALYLVYVGLGLYMDEGWPLVY